MKKPSRKLDVKRETLKALSPEALTQAAGGLVPIWMYSNRLGQCSNSYCY